MGSGLQKLSFEGKKGILIIFPEFCKGCGLCKEKCSHKVLDWSEQLGVNGTPIIHPVSMENCTACGRCETYCPDCAVLVEKKNSKNVTCP